MLRQVTTTLWVDSSKVESIQDNLDNTYKVIMVSGTIYLSVPSSVILPFFPELNPDALNPRPPPSTTGGRIQ